MSEIQCALSLLERAHIRKAPHYENKISEFDLDLTNCPRYLLVRCWYFRGIRKERFNCIISAFVFNKNSKTLGPHVLGKSVFNL